MTILACFIPGFAYAQGFDWQLSSRMPFKSPTFFIGLKSEYSIDNHFGDFQYIRKQISCNNFTTGSGNTFNIGLQAEYWRDGILALNAGLSYFSSPSNFASKFDLVKRNAAGETRTVYYQNTMESNFSGIELSLGGKYRVDNSHFHVGGLISLGFITNKTMDFYEEILGPADEPPFEPSHTYKIKQDFVEAPAINSLTLGLGLQIGYDLNLGYGSYLQPAIKLNLPMNDFTENEKWKKTSISFSITIYRGVNILD